MATAVKKSAKLNFYKFVPPLKVSGGKGDAKDAALQNGIGKNTQAINNIGATLNSLGKVLIEFRDSQVKMIGEIQASAKDTFKPIYSKPTGGPDMGELEGGEMPETEMPSWLESLFNIVKDFLILALAGPALEWLSDEKNREAIKSTIETILKVVEFVSNFIGDRVKGLIDSLHDLFFNKEQNWWEKLGSFFSAFVNFAGLFLAIRWLTNPMNIVKDFKSVLGLFVKNLKKSRGKLAGRAKALGAVAAVATLATIVVTSMNDDGGDENKPEAEKGGPVPLRASGGWINGPMSGYPVSLDGGSSTSFIGHGLEYVAQKANGGFVVPFNTPATKTNPGLTSRRIGEATSKGYNLGGMFADMPAFDFGGILPEFSGGGAFNPVLDLIAKYEAGAGKWESMYPGTRLPGATKMTISEVARRATGAVGMFQNMPRFLVGRAKAVKLDPNKALYNEQNQRKIAEYLIGRGQAGVNVDMMKTKPAEAMTRLSRVWAAIPVPHRMRGHKRMIEKGESYYAGVGSNKAHITPKMMYDAMSKVTGQPITPEVTSDLDPADTTSSPIPSAAQSFNLGEGIRGLVKNLMSTFGGEAKTDGTPKESGTTGSGEGKPANLKSNSDKPVVLPGAAPTAPAPAQTASTGGGSSAQVTQKTETVATAKRDRRTAQAQMMRNLQQQNQAQRQRIAALSQASQKAVADAQNAENSKQPIIAGGGTTTASLIDRMQSGHSLLKT